MLIILLIRGPGIKYLPNFGWYFNKMRLFVNAIGFLPTPFQIDEKTVRLDTHFIRQRKEVPVMIKEETPIYFFVV
jgi:hypothetical protein